MRILYPLILSFILLGLVGCHPAFVIEDFDPREPIGEEEPSFAPIPVDRKTDPELLKPPTDPYRLGVGDVVEIEIAEIEGSRVETFILPDGRVYYDLAGGVRVEGMTMPEAREALTQALLADYTAPVLNLTLREVNSRRIWVLGRVFSPGTLSAEATDYFVGSYFKCGRPVYFTIYWHNRRIS